MPSHKTVWTKCSEYNRRKLADDNGYVACVCCGKVKHWKEMDAGHFIPKKKGKAVYFLPENIFPQCTGCNRPYSSAQAEKVKIAYTLWMVKTYGTEAVERLQRLSRGIEHSQEIDEWNDFYTSRLKALQCG